MKQQAVSSGFFGTQVKFNCCFCNASFNNCRDLIQNTVIFDRYYYQVLDLQEESTRIIEKAKRHAFLAKNGFKPESSIIQTLTPGLNIIIGYLPEPAHSKSQGLVRRLHPFLFSKILTKRAAAEFATVFYKFAFPSGWSQIQSLATHMLS